MIEIKRILYASDLSANSAYAFNYTSEIADKFGAEIVILHVLEEIPQIVRAELERVLPEDSVDRKPRTEEEIKSRLSAFCEKTQNEDPACVFRVATIEVTVGSPAIEIIKKAEEFDCDIILMGTHGKGVLIHALLGSVAEKVLRHSRKPVFVIPLPEEKDQVGDLRDI